MKKNLLVVEDDSGLRRYFVLLLQQMGYHVTESVNGADALSLLIKRNNFHLVVTDIEMPVMTGIELLEEMDRRGIDVPVCTVSGINDDSLIKRLSALGCGDFLRKPVSCRALMEKVRTILARDGKSFSRKPSG
ncbi:MAG: response regulator [Deltaproteobacteria bacterium]|nr:response regulator [Deltaproteobacteria bacterium]